MKKLLTAAMITVCLSMAASAVAAPFPVPTKLCLKFKNQGDEDRYFLKLLLTSRGVLNGVEYFAANGFQYFVSGSVPVSGTAYRLGEKRLRMSLTGIFDLAGAGTALGDAHGYTSDHLLRLDTGKGKLTWVFDVIGEEAAPSQDADRTKIVTCNRLKNPKS